MGLVMAVVATAKLEGVDKLIKQLKSLKMSGSGSVKAGVMEGATNSSGVNVLEYAPFLEFGTKNIPSRPYLRKTFAEHNQDWLELLAKALKGGVSSETALDYVGGEMKADIIDMIKSNMPPANGPEWVKHKLKYAPAVADMTLQYTGTLVHAIDYEVTA